MGDVDRVVLARWLRVAAVAFPIIRLIGSLMWLSGFEGISLSERVWHVSASWPLTVGLGAVLYAVAVLLGRPDRVRVPAPTLVEPAVAASVLDLDAPIDHVVFQPPTPPRMTDIPIGDPHAAFRPD